jgi:ADP-ribosyl-[dinitrogen reductase] hydrolase
MEDRFTGLLLGTAVGDSLGLPAEGLSPRRRLRLFGSGWRHRLLPGIGLVSDDTEHAFFTAQALLAHPDDPRRFVRALAWSVRLWIVALPAGVGLATLRSALKLWLLFPPERSGVASAGNGPAMRAPIIGAYHCRDEARREAFVRASTLLTHTDPRALTGARAVAEAAAWAVLQPDSQVDVAGFLARLPGLAVPGDQEWAALSSKLARALDGGATVREFALSLGLEKGVTGYVHHTVPVVLYAVLRHRGAFTETLEATLECGGDADTTGAIAGALAGALSGASQIPEGWVRGIADWPLSVAVLEAAGRRLGGRIAGHGAPGPVAWAWPLLPLRNIVLLTVVLAHGLRRLLPPY